MCLAEARVLLTCMINYTTHTWQILTSHRISQDLQQQPRILCNAGTVGEEAGLSLGLVGLISMLASRQIRALLTSWDEVHHRVGMSRKEALACSATATASLLSAAANKLLTAFAWLSSQ